MGVRCQQPEKGPGVWVPTRRHHGHAHVVWSGAGHGTGRGGDGRHLSHRSSWDDNRPTFSMALLFWLSIQKSDATGTLKDQVKNSRTVRGSREQLPDKTSEICFFEATVTIQKAWSEK